MGRLNKMSLFRINWYSLMKSSLLILSLLLSTGIGMVTATEVIDPSHFDPGIWYRIQAEAAEQSRSRQALGYYSPGKENIDFRPVLEPPTDTGEGDWMTDKTGKKYRVAKTAVLNTSDIDGISIEKMSLSAEAYFSVTVYFKKESWDKVYNALKSLREHKLVITKNDKLFSSGTVTDVFISQLTLSGGLTEEDINKFCEGLTIQDRPSPEVKNKEYSEWLESYLKKKPDDIEIMS